MGGLTAQAPSTWLEDLATADTSWIFDATGLVGLVGLRARPGQLGRASSVRAWSIWSYA
jgi:hypothetical protein